MPGHCIALSPSRPGCAADGGRRRCRRTPAGGCRPTRCSTAAGRTGPGCPAATDLEGLYDLAASRRRHWPAPAAGLADVLADGRDPTARPTCSTGSATPTGGWIRCWPAVYARIAMALVTGSATSSRRTGCGPVRTAPHRRRRRWCWTRRTCCRCWRGAGRRRRRGRGGGRPARPAAGQRADRRRAGRPRAGADRRNGPRCRGPSSRPPAAAARCRRGSWPGTIRCSSTARRCRGGRLPAPTTSSGGPAALGRALAWRLGAWPRRAAAAEALAADGQTTAAEDAAE